MYKYYETHLQHTVHCDKNIGVFRAIAWSAWGNIPKARNFPR